MHVCWWQESMVVVCFVWFGVEDEKTQVKFKCWTLYDPSLSASISEFWPPKAKDSSTNWSESRLKKNSEVRSNWLTGCPTIVWCNSCQWYAYMSLILSNRDYFHAFFALFRCHRGNEIYKSENWIAIAMALLHTDSWSWGQKKCTMVVTMLFPEGIVAIEYGEVC